MLSKDFEQLVEDLKDENWEVRKTAIQSLKKLDDPRVLPELINHTDDNENVQSEMVNALTSQLNILPNTLVLVVDDNTFTLRLVRHALEQVGYEVATARTGIEALRFIHDNGLPKLAIVDYHMPGMNGKEFIQELYKISSDVPVVMLTAVDNENTILRLFALGVDDYITKPFNPPELVIRIHRVICRYNSIQSESQTTVKLLQEEISFLKKQLLNVLEYREQERQGLQVNDLPLPAIESLISGVSHDLQNGLGIIRNTITFLKEDLRQTPYLVDLEKLIQSTEFCELVLRNLSVIRGRNVFRPEPVSLKEIFCQVYRLLEKSLIDIDLIIEADDQESTIVGDKGQMQQVFMNLIKNAGEAMPEGGSITFQTSLLTQDKVLVEVRDTGTGIPSNIQEKLFKEFVTTKQKGYGIGLHIVHGIIERHKGTISVESEAGQGTTFSILLPKKQVDQ